MTQNKKLYLKAAVIMILTFSVWFIILDFSRFVPLNLTYDIFPSAILKRINVIIASVIAWTVGSYGLSRRDSLIMKAAFVFVCLGEAFFAIEERITGVYMFAACQILLTIRNSTGLHCKLAHAGRRQVRTILLTGLVILTILAAISIPFGDLINSDRRLIIIYIYGILLSISLWAGLTCSTLELLPKNNSGMAAFGMFCFYCCDVLVGLDAALETGFPWLLANSFIWVFYIPALTMLALSCYRYE